MPIARIAKFGGVAKRFGGAARKFGKSARSGVKSFSKKRFGGFGKNKKFDKLSGSTKRGVRGRIGGGIKRAGARFNQLSEKQKKFLFASGILGGAAAGHVTGKRLRSNRGTSNRLKRLTAGSGKRLANNLRKRGIKFSGGPSIGKKKLKKVNSYQRNSVTRSRAKGFGVKPSEVFSVDNRARKFMSRDGFSESKAEKAAVKFVKANRRRR